MSECNAMIVCDLYGFYLDSGHFSVYKGKAFLSLKVPLSRSLNVILML